MGNIYGYNGQLWKAIHEFEYTGQPEKFTLEPGEYLLICHGANGGETKGIGYLNFGGTAYGILNLPETMDLYAYVGGTGSPPESNTVGGKGGFNGGADGGLSYSASYKCGAGGGGASDIRLSNDDSDLIVEYNGLPDEYQEVEYIQNSTNQYIDTGIKPTIGLTMSIDFRYINDISTISDTWICGAGASYSNLYEAGYYNNELYDELGYTYSGTDPNVRFTATCNMTVNYGYNMYIFGRNINNKVSSHAIGECYKVTFSDDTGIIMQLVPCYRKSDNKAGMYDTISGTFFTDKNNGEFIAGPSVIESEYTTSVNHGPKSLFTRLIVAGGGGGSMNMNHGNAIPAHGGFGGGVYGGPVREDPSNPDNMRYATQESGYAFGYGMTPPKKTNANNNGGEGAGGGGGGWFGGYSSTSTNKTYSSSNGGGGSGYVYTELSYKPSNYMDDERLYLTDTFMNAGSALKSTVIVCEKTKIGFIGDKMIFECVGEMGNAPYKLQPGTYRIKCWGGTGGTRISHNNIAYGGYAEAVFDNPTINDIYVRVGGSGQHGFNGNEYTRINLPTISINGGGAAINYSDHYYGATAGGGASDVRIGSDSLYARLIVAGGGGGEGAGRGGHGGGSSGVAPTVTGKYGDNAGPGTQTSSPQNTKEGTTVVNGGFGYGGNAASVNGGYGGAGGGGWFGGCGTYPDESGDDDKGGSGGSGYALSASSYKPEGYLLGEEYYMREIYLIEGGNDISTVREHYTKIEIEVLDVITIRILCRDNQGYKRFDSETNSWIFLSASMPSTDDFITYGSTKLTSDAGLSENYEVLVYDQYNIGYNKMILNVIPNELFVTSTTYTDSLVSRLIPDVDIDTDNVEIHVESSRKGIAENAHIDLTIRVDMKDEPLFDTRLYCIQAYSEKKINNSYSERKEPVKTLEHLDLLPVGIGNKMPSRYKSYLGGLLAGDVAITTPTSAISREHNRNIYSCVLCNNTTYRFTKLNLITNRTEIIKDVPKSSFGNITCGDFLVDDNYFYMTSSNSNNVHVLYKIPIDPNDNTVTQHSTINSTAYNFSAYGRMEWFDDHTIVMICRMGVLYFNTITFEWVVKQHFLTSLSIRDMAVGKHKIVIINTGTTNTYDIYDIDNNSWSLGSNNQKLTNSATNVLCYGDGKFYITQKNYLYILDEETNVIEKRIITPYTSLEPATINYASGILYITINESSLLYMYDINNDRFHSTTLQFKINKWSSSSPWVRPTSFKGYFFIPNLRLFVINFVEYAKYNIGYKYDQFLFITNETYKNDYEYDERFVTFTDSHVRFHNGDIDFDLIKIDYENNISYAKVSKTLYRKLLTSTFIVDQSTEESEG